ncbi:dEAD/DEAH box family ATP-dependent RNA helicase [Prevotella sp. CAG:1124]|nr:dEAD/DEAH box family ATP-dependent RNA helicase [Prevotella sp. CAG:1124]
MQFVNRNMREGRQEIGAIDLMSKMAYFEVPEKDAEKVMRALDGTTYKGRQVRCNDADRGNSGSRRGGRKDDKYGDKGKQSRRRDDANAPRKERKGRKGNDGKADNGNNEDWRQFFNKGGNNVRLVGEEPDFSEEGWARRKPKK